MNVPAIQIQDLHYSYRSDFLMREIVALRGITVSVASGEAFGYLGPNGAGKTTTIKCILGLIRARAGSVEIAGYRAGSREARARIGYLAEQPYFYDYLTVTETMALFATLAGLRGADRTKKIGEALERVGMQSRSASRMRSLSKGLTQRVALAQALVAHPSIVILDEPFSGLDPVGRREFREIFLDLKRSGATLFMSSHVLGDVEHLCDRASVTVKGQLKAIIDIRKRQREFDQYEVITGIPLDAPLLSELRQLQADAIRDRLVEHRTVLEISGDALTQQVLQKITSRNIPVVQVEQRQPSLEDLFMKIVEQR